MSVLKECKRSYREDIKIFQTNFSLFWLYSFITFILVIPFIVDRHILSLLVFTECAVIGAIGLNILTGFTGQISLGQAGFLAVGSYTTAIFAKKLGLPFYITMPLSGIISAIIGLIVGLPSIKLKGFYLALSTLAFSKIIEHLAYRWVSLTGGAFGLDVPPPSIAGYYFNTERRLYYLFIVIVFFVIIYAKNILRTKVGRAFIAIRDSDISSKVIGINLIKYKLLSFMISSFYAGIAGSAYAYTLNFIAPDHFNIFLSVGYIAMIIVGGLGSILGSIYGAIVITLLPETIRIIAGKMGTLFPILNEAYLVSKMQKFIFGFIIVIFLLLEPTGLRGLWERVKTYWKSWPFTY
jgi:branched-chain amino acid transport system permease protein